MLADTTFARAGRWLLILGVVSTSSACGNTSLESVGSLAHCFDVADFAIDQNAPLPPVELISCPLERTSTTDEVWLFVGLRNRSSRPQLVDLRFDLFASLGVWVTGPDGIERAPRSGWEPGDITERFEPYFQHESPRVSRRPFQLSPAGSV